MEWVKLKAFANLKAKTRPTGFKNLKFITFGSSNSLYIKIIHGDPANPKVFISKPYAFIILF